MVKILCNLTEIVTKTNINWSGDYKQAARTLTFDYLAVEKSCHAGDKVTLFDDDGSILFVGQVYNCDYNSTARTFSVVCYDLLNNLLRSKAVGRFEGTAGMICSRICSQFNLISTISAGATLQEIITTGDYTYYDVMAKAIKKAIGTDEVFNIRVKNGVNVVLDRPGSAPVHSLSNFTNIGESAFGESIEKMVNRIVVSDVDGEVVETRQNALDIARYGLFQEVEREKDTEEDDLNEKELHGIDYTAELRNCIGNTKCITGNTVAVTEPRSGFVGNFFIITDSHTWEDGKHIMNLGLQYEAR